MRKLFVTACAAALTATTFTMAPPANAASFKVPLFEQSGSHGAATPVQYRKRGYYHRNGRPYYNGHRGYREPRRGYRRYRGFWFPPEAFAAAIIGGAIQSMMRNDRPRYNRHVAWCYDRYRSYRASDNTFQPYNGPRRPCRSPYSR
ncbi:BA14K family protein [Breoghania sp. L-A4]|uniref:BA14K family protein n=1 Tax=Breoghania sp. L-A4 TaxID=2304600 RepID=UPI000E35DE7E|nr:BA14K family protein [Breoghania sp. L-A4]AXS42548.1 BA14K family protein [Breoghania sp. L-A4]